MHDLFCGHCWQIIVGFIIGLIPYFGYLKYKIKAHRRLRCSCQSKPVQISHTEPKND